jgi:hypothetical protein
VEREAQAAQGKGEGVRSEGPQRTKTQMQEAEELEVIKVISFAYIKPIKMVNTHFYMPTLTLI